MGSELPAYHLVRHKAQMGAARTVETGHGFFSNGFARRLPDRSLGFQQDRQAVSTLDVAMKWEDIGTYPAWAGIKRRWVPFRLWEWATASRRLGRSRFVRWILNRTTWRAP